MNVVYDLLQVMQNATTKCGHRGSFVLFFSGSTAPLQNSPPLPFLVLPMEGWKTIKRRVNILAFQVDIFEVCLKYKLGWGYCTSAELS